MRTLKEDLRSKLEIVSLAVNNTYNAKDRILPSIEAQINLNDTLNQLEGFWVEADGKVNTAMGQLHRIVDIIDGYLGKYADQIQVGVLCVGGLFSLMVLAVGCITILLIIQACRIHLFTYPDAELASASNFLMLIVDSCKVTLELHVF